VSGCSPFAYPAASVPALAMTPTAPLGTPLFTYRGHSRRVTSIAWSPDGRQIASASGDGSVQVWDTFTGAHVLTYRGHHGPANDVAWSPDNEHIASAGDDGTVQVWQAISS
jgi:WD40 repeat protein